MFNSNNKSRSKWNLIQQGGIGRGEYGKRLGFKSPLEVGNAVEKDLLSPEWGLRQGKVVPFSFAKLSWETKWSVLKSAKCTSKWWNLPSLFPRRNKRQLDVVNKEKTRVTQRLQRRSKKTRWTSCVSVHWMCFLCARALSQEKPGSVGRLLRFTPSTQTAVAVAVPKNMMEWVNKSCTWELHH